MKKIIVTEKAPKAIGPYSQAVLAHGFLYISGQIPLEPITGIIPVSIEEQSHQCLKNIGGVLEEAGLTYHDVVKTTIFLADMNDFAVVNAIYKEYFTENFPARSTVEVSRLPRDAKIEIESIAIV